MLTFALDEKKKKKISLKNSQLQADPAKGVEFELIFFFVV